MRGGIRFNSIFQTLQGALTVRATFPNVTLSPAQFPWTSHIWYLHRHKLHRNTPRPDSRELSNTADLLLWSFVHGRWASAGVQAFPSHPGLLWLRNFFSMISEHQFAFTEIRSSCKSLSCRAPCFLEQRGQKPNTILSCVLRFYLHVCLRSLYIRLTLP